MYNKIITVWAKITTSSTVVTRYLQAWAESQNEGKERKREQGGLVRFLMSSGFFFLPIPQLADQQCVYSISNGQ